MKKIIDQIASFLRAIFRIPLPRVFPPFDPTANGYKLMFREDFALGIDWNKWDPSEPWSGIESTYKGIVRWMQQNVQMAFPAGIKLVATRSTEGGNDLCGLISSHKFLEVLYGYISVRAKIPPKGFLYFPAIWMYNIQGWLPEIDIMEAMDKTSEHVSFTHHWLDSNGNHLSEGNNWKSPIDLSLDYHNYSVEWTPGKLTWYIDGIARYSTTNNIPGVPLFLICNIQAGGNPAYSHLYTSDEVPMSFYIEKIEVYQKP